MLKTKSTVTSSVSQGLTYREVTQKEFVRVQSGPDMSRWIGTTRTGRSMNLARRK